MGMPLPSGLLASTLGLKFRPLVPARGQAQFHLGSISVPWKQLESVHLKRSANLPCQRFSPIVSHRFRLPLNWLDEKDYIACGLVFVAIESISHAKPGSLHNTGLSLYFFFYRGVGFCPESLESLNSFTKTGFKADLFCSDTQKCNYRGFLHQRPAKQADTPFRHWLDTTIRPYRARMEDTGIPFIFAITTTSLKDGDKKEDRQAGAKRLVLKHGAQ